MGGVRREEAEQRAGRDYFSRSVVGVLEAAAATKKKDARDLTSTAKSCERKIRGGPIRRERSEIAKDEGRIAQRGHRLQELFWREGNQESGEHLLPQRCPPGAWLALLSL